MEIVVTKITVRGNQVFIAGGDGKDYSGFANDKNGQPTGLATLKENDVIDAEIKVNGKYNNIVKFMKVCEKEPETKPAVLTLKTAISGEPNLKNRAFALSYAKDLCVAGKLTIDQIIFKADEFDTYLNGK